MRFKNEFRFQTVRRFLSEEQELQRVAPLRVVSSSVLVSILFIVFAGSLYGEAPADASSRDCGRAAQILSQLFKRGTTDSTAEEEGRKAVELCPQMAEAHFNLGVILAAQSKNEEAIGAFDKAIAARDSANFRVARATTLTNMGRLDDAAAEFNRALKDNPTFVPALQGLGVVLEKQGKTSEAIDRLLEARKIDGSQPLTWFNLGVLYERKNEIDSAIEAYRRAVQIDPKYFQAHVALGNLLSGRSEFEAAEAALRKASEISPEDPNVPKALGNLYREEGQLEKAELMFRQATRRSDSDLEAWIGLAEVQLSLKRAERAQESAQKAVELSPEDARALRLLGWSELELGKIEAAEKNFKSALSLSPGDPKSHRAIADFYSRSGKSELAAQHRASAEGLEKEKSD